MKVCVCKHSQPSDLLLITCSDDDEDDDDEMDDEDIVYEPDYEGDDLAGTLSSTLADCD